MKKTTDISEFKDCILGIDYKGNCYLIDAQLISGEKYELKKDIFGLLDESSEDGSFLFCLKEKTQGVYKGDIIYKFIEYSYPPEAVEYGYEIELKNLEQIHI